MKKLLHLTNNSTNHHMEEQCVTYYHDLNVVQCSSFILSDATFTVWTISVTCVLFLNRTSISFRVECFLFRCLWYRTKSVCVRLCVCGSERMDRWAVREGLLWEHSCCLITSYLCSNDHLVLITTLPQNVTFSFE